MEKSSHGIESTFYTKREFLKLAAMGLVGCCIGASGCAHQQSRDSAYGAEETLPPVKPFTIAT